ncbi:MAG: hypothetical protein H7Y11_15400 [Armatimonadetes bacterium]|nr:hypothetical protein [Anaerolineae bacterium]
MGNVSQSITNVAAELRKALGEELLQDEPSLNNALIAFESADELTRLEKMGLVVQELGRCLAHTANTVTILGGLKVIVDLFPR